MSVGRSMSVQRDMLCSFFLPARPPEGAIAGKFLPVMGVDF